MVLICLITELKYLTPFSLVANVFIGKFLYIFAHFKDFFIHSLIFFASVLCIIMTVYYSVQEDPKFEGMKPYTTFYGMFEFLAMSVFSMSFAGIALPVCNKIKDPNQLVVAVPVGKSTIYNVLSFRSFNKSIDRFLAFLFGSLTRLA